MPRLTEAQSRRLRQLQRVIRGWKGTEDPMISELAEATGLSPHQVEACAGRHGLAVRRSARTTREQLSERYCAAIEGMRDWCEQDGRSFRASMIAAMQAFMRRRV